MKKIAMAAGLIVSFAAQAQAQAAELACWNTYSRSKTPALKATILSGRRLSGIKVKTTNGTVGDVQTRGSAKGELIVTNRSPYKGNVRYILSKDLELILPASLDNDDLIAAQETGIGQGKGENGVMIGIFDGDGSGSHYSVRLRCRSYAN